MARGVGGRRRWRVDDDDGDEEDYVAKEEEEVYREVSVSSAGEEGGGSDAEYEVDEEDEDDETPLPKQAVKGNDPGRKRKRNPSAVQSQQRRYEEEDDYSKELEEDQEEEEEPPRLKHVTKCSRRSQKAKLHVVVAERSNRWREDEDDDDFEPDLDEGEEEETGDYQDDLGEEEESPQLNRVKKCASRSQKANQHPVDDRSNRRAHKEEEDDMDFEPDLEESEEEEGMDFDPDVEDDDEEFEDDEEELDFGQTSKVRVNNTVRRKPASKQRGRKKKSYSTVSRRKVNSTKVRKVVPARQRRKRSLVDHYEDDDDFIVDEQVEVNRQSKKKARMGRRTKVDYPDDEADAWPAVDSDTSDFDFVTSDEEHQDIEQVLAEPVRVAVRKERRKMTFDSGSSSESEFYVSRNEPGVLRETEVLEAGRENMTAISQPSSDSEFHVLGKELGNSAETKMKRRIFVMGSSSDSEFHVPNEVLGDYRDSVEAQPMLPASLRISVKRDVDDKGKEKTELLDTGKPRCGICLSEDQRMTLQGVLNCCPHYFCFACIMEWSKVESRCPLCKRRFTMITKSSKVDIGSELKKSVIRVEERDQVYQPTEEEIRRWLDPYENLVCIECNEGGDDSLMLLCDICDSSAHTYCVGLGREVPEGNWYCGGCRLSGEGPSHPRSSVNSSSSEFDTTVLTHTFERLPSINHHQHFQWFDLNVSPREISGENHPIRSQSSTAGVSTPSGRLATLCRRRGWIRTLLDRQRPVIGPDMDI